MASNPNARSFVTSMVPVLSAVWAVLGSAWAAGQTATISEVTFPAQPAKAVRISILATTDHSAPCLDELEVYAQGNPANLALAQNGGKASASSCLAGYAIHQVENLTDGQYGNDHSWIPAEGGAAWAQIDFAAAQPVERVVFSRDRLGAFKDRRVKAFELSLLSPTGEWKKVEGLTQEPGGPDDIPNAPPAPEWARAKAADAPEDLVTAAFLAEEYAWLKAYGRADFDPAVSSPRYNQERRGPRHHGDDRLPLPCLAHAPKLDGRTDEKAWQDASMGGVRVASLADFNTSPLVEYRVRAGSFDGELYLALAADRLLTGHLAVLSGANWRNVCVLALEENNVVLRSYNAAGLVKSEPVECGVHQADRVFELRLTRKQFPLQPGEEVRIGLGIGGKNTPKLGRAVVFQDAPFFVAEEALKDGAFQVRIGRDARGVEAPLRANLPGWDTERIMATSETISIPANAGALGPEFDLSLTPREGAPFSLHLFQYSAAQGPLTQAEALAARLAREGVDTTAEQQRLAGLRKHQQALAAHQKPAPREERALFLAARQEKRALFYRSPGLEGLETVLFEKRFPFNPSHNYSELLDGAWRPGGGVFRLSVPRENGRLVPEHAQLAALFDAGEGVVRNPMATFDAKTIYFAYRPSKDGYFHLYRMNADGAEPRALTDGPFHDYWPCPLPDGGVAFISTRCKRRFLCWRPQAATLHRMDANGENIRPLSFANLTEWAPSVMQDGRIIWTRSEYQDKAADFGHTLWAIRPDGTHPELVFGNTITAANGYAYGREVPGTSEVACTLISHFGDLNGPVALLDTGRGRFNTDAIASITPEVFWPGSPPLNECFREPVPLSKDYFLCSHAALNRFDLYVIDRSGNRELLYADPKISSQCPTPLMARPTPPIWPEEPANPETPLAELFVQDVYQGIEPAIQRGQVAYLEVSVEVTHDLDRLTGGVFRSDHEPFQQFYASPSDVLTGPFGWPTYVVKQSLGTVPVEADGSAHFTAPSGKVLFFHLLDKDYNELQRMRSVLQLQPGEQRSCIGCHEGRQSAALPPARAAALQRPPSPIQAPPWGDAPFAYETVVQPVLDAKCVSCHNPAKSGMLDFTGTHDANKIPASYRTFIAKGLVHYADWTWSNPDVCKKVPPLSLGTVKSPLWKTLNAGHHGVKLTTPEMRAIKTWIDLNCPLWGDYTERSKRVEPGTAVVSKVTGVSSSTTP